MRTEDEAKRQQDSGYDEMPGSPRSTAAPGAMPAIPKKPPPPRKRMVLLGLLAIAVVVGGYFAIDWWMVGRHLISTDDAYVHADFSILAPKVSGYVASIPATENQHVKAGDPLVVLDDGDYRLSLSSAESKIASQYATLDRLDRQIVAGNAAVEQARAQKTAADADQERAKADFTRYQTLAASDYASRQRLETAKADQSRANASVAQAVAGVAAAEANRDVVCAQRAEAEHALKELENARDQARRDLDAAIVRAPFDGIIGNRAVAVGDYVSTGKRLLAVVPLGGVYIDANFKETQIQGMKPGTPVRIEIDAYPDREIYGEVASVSPASGAVFSLLPPENATGNFTKIVQRVPVRIEVPADVAAEEILRPGMSVVVTADPEGVSEIAEARAE